MKILGCTTAGDCVNDTAIQIDFTRYIWQISDSCTIATTELYQARDEVGLGEAKWS